MIMLPFGGGGGVVVVVVFCKGILSKRKFISKVNEKCLARNTMGLFFNSESIEWG